MDLIHFAWLIDFCLVDLLGIIPEKCFPENEILELILCFLKCLKIRMVESLKAERPNGRITKRS